MRKKIHMMLVLLSSYLGCLSLFSLPLEQANAVKLKGSNQLVGSKSIPVVPGGKPSAKVVAKHADAGVEDVMILLRNALGRQLDCARGWFLVSAGQHKSSLRTTIAERFQTGATGGALHYNKRVTLKYSDQGPTGSALDRLTQYVPAVSWTELIPERYHENVEYTAAVVPIGSIPEHSSSSPSFDWITRPETHFIASVTPTLAECSALGYLHADLLVKAL
ncbi:unnamed protein product, partial [Amoebophrya sp. A25]|eukprot:GSA25T00006496001.1